MRMDAAERRSVSAVAYAATIFLSALLLFQIQPLVGKQILPWFGGSPAVWTVCLLFFQTLLLAGYAYAHVSHRWLRPRNQALLHIALLAAAAMLLLLGVLPNRRWEYMATLDPVWQILLILAASVGLPYFVLSATGPLVQAWFGQIFPGRGPYRLYALSNAGSLVALLSYPFVFERLFDLPQQARIWSFGFAIFALLCGYAAVRLATNRLPLSSSKQAASDFSPRPRPLRHVLWLAWPALACIMLMATTQHISTDIAATPFLWVVPLALYLLTLIVAFDRPNWYRPTITAFAMLAAIYASGLVHKEGVGSIDFYDCGTPGRLYELMIQLLVERPADGPPPESLEFRVDARAFLAVNLAAMFAACLLCHGELVRQRPDPRFLTSFYLMIAAGGTLGGMFVALIAPRLFSTFFEWQLSLFAAALLGVTLLLRAIVNFALGDVDANPRPARFLVSPLAIAALLIPAMVLLDLTEFLQPRDAGTLHRVRNFFGAIAVHERDKDHPLSHDYVLRHGTITHGTQFEHPSRRRQPTTYFGHSSGVGRTINFYKAAGRQDGGMRIGVVGLGIGTLATYVDAGEAITFYELNPAVVDIAQNGDWFTYLKDCRERGGQVEITLGDARLSLDGVRRGKQTLNCHVLVLDAFSGDSIPMHLLTAEAFEIYLAHLSTKRQPASAGDETVEVDGAIAVNVSNRFVDLEPVLRGMAEHFDLQMVRVHNKANRAEAIYSADWIVLSRNEALLRDLAPLAREPASSFARRVLWTDKRSSLFDVLK
jgi:hypothetical protein